MATTQEPTVEGKTFDEWVKEHEILAPRQIAVEMTSLLFGYGGDVQLDVMPDTGDTQPRG